MSDKILQQILEELSSLKSDISSVKSDISSVKSQLDENTQIVNSIRDRREETDAKLENLTMDVHSMRGELTALTGNVLSNKKELEFISHKTYLNEMEIFNLRRSGYESKTT